jgi:uncharacterized protein (TIRG00374 family)
MKRISVRGWLTILLSAIVSGGAVAYVASTLNWQLVQGLLIGLDWGWLLLAWSVFLVNYVLRTLRFRTLIPASRSIPFRKMFSVASLHGMFNYLMPARSGEFSFLVLLKLQLSVPATGGAATLVTARFLDVLVVAMFLPAALAAFGGRLGPALVRNALVASGLLVGLGIGVLWLARHSPQILSPVHNQDLTERQNLLRSLRKRVQTAWWGLLEGFRRIDQKGQYRQLWLLTTCIWLCVYTNTYLVVRSLGYEISYLHIAVVTIIMVPTKLLPLQGFANLGTHELGWVAGLVLLGLSHETSLTIAAGSHVILFLFVLALGTLGAVLSLLDGRETPFGGQSLDDQE